MLDFVKPPIDLPVSQTDNPYWDIIRTLPGDEIEWKYRHIWTPSRTSMLFNGDGSLKPPEQRRDRNELCGTYTWAIPDPASLNFVAQWCNPAAVEIGAGVGYWAWQLSQLGVDIVAYDLFPPQHTGQNHYHSPRTEEGDALLGVIRDVFHNVQAGNEMMAAKHPDRVLFLCWPPMSDMAVKSLEHYQGKRVVYIGEGDGGCTADDAFFEKLSQEWEEVAEHRLIQWDGIHDYITVYERIAGTSKLLDKAQTK